MGRKSIRSSRGMPAGIIELRREQPKFLEKLLDLLRQGRFSAWDAYIDEVAMFKMC